MNHHSEEKPKKKKTFLHYFLYFSIILLFLLILIALYSHYMGNKGIVIHEHRIANKQIPKNFHGIKIVHISDLHIQSLKQQKQLEILVKKINLTKPDLIILTGDLLDNQTKMTDKLVQMISQNLSKMEASIGKYAIMGENDFHFSNWGIIIENGGFYNLNNNYELIYKDDLSPIVLVGISTQAENKSVSEKLKLFNDFVKSNQKDFYTILAMHEPDIINSIDPNRFSLMLAGHSHNGYINIPWIQSWLLKDEAKEYYKPYYLIKQTPFYISNGIGLNDSFRLFNRPSFNLYRLNYTE